MKIQVSNCKDCLFCEFIEDLEYGLYSTGRFQVFCRLQDKYLTEGPIYSDELDKRFTNKIDSSCTLHDEAVTIEI